MDRATMEAMQRQKEKNDAAMAAMMQQNSKAGGFSDAELMKEL